MAVLLVLGTLVAIYLLLILKTVLQRRKYNIIGPFPLPLFGTKLLDYWDDWCGTNTMLLSVERDLKRYGHTYRKNHIVTTIDPDVIAYWTMELDKYWRGSNVWSPGRKLMDIFLGKEGLFNIDGQPWADQRAILRPLFAHKSLDSMFPTMVEKSLATWELFKEAAESGEPLNEQYVFSSYTMDVFTIVALGKDFNSLRNPNSFSDHFDAALRLIDECLFNPLVKEDNVMDEMAVHMKVLDDYMFGLIEDSDCQGTDLLSHFKKHAQGQPDYRVWIRDLMINLTIAGRDTTAMLLTWATQILSEHPEVVKKARAEIYEVLGDRREPIPADMPKLKYIGNIFNEVLRLAPPVPYLFRFAQVDDVWPDGTHIFKGDVIGYSAYYMGRSPDFWDQPDRFWPERWDMPQKTVHPYLHLPFHCGPMQCIGRHMALMESKIVFAIVLRDFDFTPCTSKPFTPYFGMILTTRTGIHINVTEAKKEELKA